MNDDQRDIFAARTQAVLSSCDAVRTDGHFVYTSGRHGNAYVNKDAVYPHTALVSELCAMFADLFADLAVDVVCGPALGGIILSQWTAHHLAAATDRDVLGVYAEKVPDGLELRRGYDTLVADRRVAVVEDVVNTGGSIAQAVAAVRAAGGDVVAAACLANRGGVAADDVDVPVLHSLISLDFTTYDADACPLCAQDVPVDTSVGKGAAFLAARGN
jgi:orotate phosphoribosyltransferase